MAELSTGDGLDGRAFFRGMRQGLCKHKFDYGDMKRTEFSDDRRIEWPCWKCGKLFVRHCGLEVLHHGEVLAKPTSQ